MSHHFVGVLLVSRENQSAATVGMRFVCRKGQGEPLYRCGSMLVGAAREVRAGEEQFANGRWEDARRHFLEAIRLEPNRADYYFAAAMCDWAGGQIGNAGEYLQ